MKNKSDIEIVATLIAAHEVGFDADDFEENVKSWETTAKEIVHKLNSRAPVNEWQPIETAPRDGTVIELYRPLSKVGTASQIIFGAWKTTVWIWPDDVFNPYQEGKFHNQLENGVFCSDEFTFWKPLPQPPKGE